MRVRPPAVAGAFYDARPDRLDKDVRARLALESARVPRTALGAIVPHAMWAVDTAYAADSTELTNQSEVALIPPVSGG